MQEFVEATELELHRLIPSAERGVQELGVLALLAVWGDFEEKWTRVANGPVFGHLLTRSPLRPTGTRQRKFVSQLNKRLHGTYHRIGADVLDNAAQAWASVRADYEGDTIAAWESIKDTGRFRDRNAMVDAIRPFDRAFGLKVHQGRPPWERDSARYREA